MFRQLKDLLPKQVNKQGLSSQFNAIEIINSYKKACEHHFDEEALLFLRPRYFKNGVLHIQAENPAWSQQLHMKRAEVIKTVNQNLGVEKVKEISITV